jgi:hypothetical protein
MGVYFFQKTLDVYYNISSPLFFECRIHPFKCTREAKKSLRACTLGYGLRYNEAWEMTLHIYYRCSTTEGLHEKGRLFV